MTEGGRKERRKERERKQDEMFRMVAVTFILLKRQGFYFLAFFTGIHLCFLFSGYKPPWSTSQTNQQAFLLSMTALHQTPLTIQKGSLWHHFGELPRSKQRSPGYIHALSHWGHLKKDAGPANGSAGLCIPGNWHWLCVSVQRK